MIRLVIIALLLIPMLVSGIGFGPTCPAVHAVAGFMPTQVRYLQLWLDVNRACMPQGVTLDRWEDFSLVAQDPAEATGTGKPSVSIVNGRPCLKFDGVNDYASIGNFDLVTSICLYAVVKDGASRFFIEHSNNSQLNDGFCFKGGDTPWSVRRSTLTRGVNGTDGWVGGDFAVISFKYEVATTNGVFTKNGVEQSISSFNASGAPVESSADTALYIGCRGGLDFFSDFSIAELVIVTNSIRAPVEQSMIRYLGVKYGIVVP
jgi:hypothetical protein